MFTRKTLVGQVFSKENEIPDFADHTDFIVTDEIPGIESNDDQCFLIYEKEDKGWDLMDILLRANVMSKSLGPIGKFSRHEHVILVHLSFSDTIALLQDTCKDLEGI